MYENTATDDEHKPRYIAYLCSPTNELRGSVVSTTGACMQWAVRRSKMPFLESRYKMQMKCPHCGNRPRVGEHEVYIFDERETADLFIQRQNEEAKKAMEQPKDEWFE